MPIDAAQDRTEPNAMTADDLASLAVVFGVLSRAFWEEPQNGIVSDLSDALPELARAPFATAAPLGAADLARALEAYRENPQEQMGLFKQDRADLFYEIGYSRTSPYESAYRTVDRTLFGPTTEQVKADFERHGLSCERPGNEPADHFALECAYIQQIAQAGAEAAADGDRPAFEGARRELCRFLGAHLLVFAPIYLQNFTKRASTAFYRSLGQTASEALAWAERLTGAKPAEVLDIADFPLKTRRAGKEY